MVFKSINPANLELLGTFEPISPAEAARSVELADEAYRHWRRRSLDDRSQILMNFAQRLRDNSEELALLITTEMGKRIAESRYEVEYCAKIADFYAKGAASFLAPQKMPVVDADAQVNFEPLGAILGIMPWNFPFYQVVRFAAPNLMAGNVVLLKHAPNVQLCAERIERLFRESGVPEHVYTNLVADVDLIEGILQDRRVRGVSLTGSERAGSSVGAMAGRFLKRSVLELGGNDPFIVLEDADLDHAVDMAVRGRMVNCGQSCVASKRFIVVAPLADAFTHAFRERLANLVIGDPLDEATEVGPLSSESAAERLIEQVTTTLDGGAQCLLGGKRDERAGIYFQPTILCEVQPHMRAYDEELFGPVATIHRVNDEEEAIAQANDSSYGLGASVYTVDVDRARRVASQIESGMVFINQPTRSQAELPFGGIKNSGYGRELSHLGILEFVNQKLIHRKYDSP
jgi:succinate-semialdehyde dehydrogenase / glutarate-semialdehyde dehydrogenase